MMILGESLPICISIYGIHHNLIGANLLHTINNYVRVSDYFDDIQTVPVGYAVDQNTFNDRSIMLSIDATASSSESFGVTTTLSASAKAQLKSTILPIGVEWQTSIASSQADSETLSFSFGVTKTIEARACERIRVDVNMKRSRRSATALGGRWEMWEADCPLLGTSTIVILCGPTEGSGFSNRYFAYESSSGFANPKYVPGCHDPASGGGDSDGDGDPNIDDPDVDGDGDLNGDDNDIDGDGWDNDDPNETDMDGDGQPDTNDSDMDGDGIDNTDDDDMDGDGIPNDEDDDMDGDGVPNDVDDDMDGDGVTNDEDDDPDGPSDGDGWLDILLDIINKVIRILFV
tara:strand:- start:20047 stop:21081 length:1035 start_codon:yes stop_codon:yes gene_type:complete